MLIFWSSLLVFLSLARYFLDLFYLKKILPLHQKRVIVIANVKNLEKVLSLFKFPSRYGWLIGFVSTRKHTVLPEGAVHLGTLDEFSDILRHTQPDEVILSDLEIPRKRIIRLILESEKSMISFKIVADLLDVMVQQFELESVDGVNLIKFKESPLTYAYNRFLKRIIDLAGSFLGLCLLSPFLFIVAILIKLDSRGPVFFRQERMSEDGGVFTIYKFRTMCADAEKESGPVFTKKSDERCTKFGIFLRKWNIDELPQLFNVLRGEISLVGPRPERPHFVNQFKEDIPRYMARHHIKSGITGWAQVHGLRQDSSIEERLKYDLYYIENWSIWFDVKIILMSFFATQNAY